MTSSVTFHEAEPSARHRGHEARLLADSLRTSRVTLLYGEGGVSRTELLTEGVLPLLRRRSGDGPSRANRRARSVAPVTERRNTGEGRRRRSERVVLFNDWAGAPLAALEVSILSSLPMGVVMRVEHHRLSDLLAELCDRLDARFLIVFDGFERLWELDAGGDALLEFVDQFVEAANRTEVSANFLLSIDASAAQRLETLRHRIPGFDDSTLWLHAAPPRPANPEAGERPVMPVPRLQTAQLPVLPLVDAVPAQVRPERIRRRRPPRQPLPPPVPIKTETVYAFIESTLTQTADASEPWHGTTDAAVVGKQAAPAAVKDTERRIPGSPSAGATLPRTAGPVLLQLDEHIPLRVEPPSPIDQWLDAGISWCRRLLRLR